MRAVVSSETLGGAASTHAAAVVRTRNVSRPGTAQEDS